MKKILTTLLSVLMMVTVCVVNVSADDPTPAELSSNVNEVTFIAGSADYTEFTFTTTLNDDSGVQVNFVSDFGNENKFEALEFEAEQDNWVSVLQSPSAFGGSDGFQLANFTLKFRAKFKEGTEGKYNFKVTGKKVEGGEEVCSLDCEFAVYPSIQANNYVYGAESVDIFTKQEGFEFQFTKKNSSISNLVDTNWITDVTTLSKEIGKTDQQGAFEVWCRPAGESEILPGKLGKITIDKADPKYNAPVVPTKVYYKGEVSLISNLEEVGFTEENVGEGLGDIWYKVLNKEDEVVVNWTKDPEDIKAEELGQYKVFYFVEPGKNYCGVARGKNKANTVAERLKGLNPEFDPKLENETLAILAGEVTMDKGIPAYEPAEFEDELFYQGEQYLISNPETIGLTDENKGENLGDIWYKVLKDGETFQDWTKDVEDLKATDLGIYKILYLIDSTNSYKGMMWKNNHVDPQNQVNHSNETHQTYAITAGEVEIKARNINDSVVEISIEEKVPYTGEEIENEPIVKLTNADGTVTTLIEGEDYTLTYEDNIELGNATVTITGINNFTGSKDVNFTIVKADNERLSKDGDYISTKAFEKFVDKKATFIATAPAGDLKSVKIDGNWDVTDEVTVKDGSTIVIIDDEIINKLSLGEHTVTLNYRNYKSVSFTFEVWAANAKETTSTTVVPVKIAHTGVDF